MSSQGWVGVDLDGTLAFYERWEGPAVIGEPVPAMLERVRAWRERGQEVRVMTARANRNNNPAELEVFRAAWAEWSTHHLGEVLPLTAEKDYRMVCLYDDRAVGVERNTGRLVGEADPK